MKDFLGNTIKAGDVLAVAQKRGTYTRLVQRFVRRVADSYVEVQATPEEPSDRREIGRLLSTESHTIIIS